MSSICCERMDRDLEQKCAEHPNRFDCPDAFITKAKGGFGLIVHDGGSSSIAIEYCPWCGTKLNTLRNRD